MKRMMKKMKSLWALLPVAVALIVASCSSEDATEPASGNNSGTKTIPVTITVGMDNATRATVGDDNSSLYFQTGDKLAVLYSGAQIALLNNTSIDEGSSSATFQGNMTVSNAAESYGTVTVVLIGQNNVGVQTNNDYSWANSGSAICVANGNSTALNEAVKKYSYLTGTGTFNPGGPNNFTLLQHTAFLNFYVTFKDGTTANTNLSVTVTNNNSTIGTGSVTTTTEATNNDVVANFVVPVPAGTEMNGATVTFTGKDPITLSTTATLAGQSYKVEKWIGTPPAGVGAVQLWAGGPYWATMNVGASSPEEYGDYFAWGEVEPKSDYSWASYKWDNHTSTENDYQHITKYLADELLKFPTPPEYTDNILTLEAGDDAATVNWGSDWRTPKKEEFQDLLDNTDYEWCESNNVQGCKFKDKRDANNYIFLPCPGLILETQNTNAGDTGVYWSSDLLWPWSNQAHTLQFSGSTRRVSQQGRDQGLPVRAIHN